MRTLHHILLLLCPMIKSKTCSFPKCEDVKDQEWLSEQVIKLSYRPWLCWSPSRFLVNKFYPDLDSVNPLIKDWVKYGGNCIDHTFDYCMRNGSVLIDSGSSVPFRHGVNRPFTWFQGTILTVAFDWKIEFSLDDRKCEDMACDNTYKFYFQIYGDKNIGYCYYGWSNYLIMIISTAWAFFVWFYDCSVDHLDYLLLYKR